jgi:hypothetical protein
MLRQFGIDTPSTSNKTILDTIPNLIVLYDISKYLLPSASAYVEDKLHLPGSI